jgi:hypothetical protein
MPPTPVPDPGSTDKSPDDPEYLSELWNDLDWSPWVPFDAPKEFWYIPREPGLYRIRPAGKTILMYIDETGRSLSGLLNELRQTMRRKELMPWNDPHAVAPGLWAWEDAWQSTRKEVVRMKEPADTEVPPEETETGNTPEPYGYEVSAAPLDASTAGRKGMENFLLYRYRQEAKESPLCNFGRFHPRYRRSSNHKDNLRGGKLAENQKDNPAGFPSLPPLEPCGKPGDSDWMGLEWTDPVPLTAENAVSAAPGAGLYLLFGAGNREVLYIGQTADIPGKILDESRKERDVKDLWFSYQVLGVKVFPHNLRELECDLIGNFYEQNKIAPQFQFRR